MPLQLTLHTPSIIPLEVDSVRLETVRAQSADEVLRTLIQRGNRQQPLGEFFSVRGSAAEDATLVWQGDCRQVRRIGAGWTAGTLRVEGDAGMHLGSAMGGGEIICEGHAADWAGAEMKGGRLTICGDAGHQLGAVYPGGRRGMTGGEILVHGNAGDDVGHTMRRGLIAIRGRCGDTAGARVIAGTILIGGTAGIRHGAAMKRGSIIFCEPGESLAVLPTFRAAATYRPVFLQLFLRRLAALGFPTPEHWFTSRYRRYCGDLLELGRGELLVREPA